MYCKLAALFALLLPAFVAPDRSSTSTQAPSFRFLTAALSVDRAVGPAYSPTQIRDAYDFTPLYKEGFDGTGQTIALIEVDAFDRADVRVFDAAYGLPDPHIVEHTTGGPRFKLERGGETTMDVEWAHALAPAATIQIYYLDNGLRVDQGWREMGQALRLAASNGATAVSISLNSCGPGQGYQVTSQSLADLARAGITVFVSSGDSGAHPGPVYFCGKRLGVAYPAGDPSVVSVGGTSLMLNNSGAVASETAWRLSGGGRVKRLARSSWQTAVNIPSDRSRWVPDVAFVADPGTGINIRYRGAWEQAGGTSVGAPCWAAAWVLIREQALSVGITPGAAPSLVYRLANSSAYPDTFRDIVLGGNRHYRARKGWDAVTGLGAPDVAGIAASIAPLPTELGPTRSQLASARGILQ